MATGSRSARWGIAPYFVVYDVVASAHYYRDKLGFGYERLFGEPPSFCMVRRRTSAATGFASATTRRGDG